MKIHSGVQVDVSQVVLRGQEADLGAFVGVSYHPDATEQVRKDTPVAPCYRPFLPYTRGHRQ